MVDVLRDGASEGATIFKVVEGGTRIAVTGTVSCIVAKGTELRVAATRPNNDARRFAARKNGTKTQGADSLPNGQQHSYLQMGKAITHGVNGSKKIKMTGDNATGATTILLRQPMFEHVDPDGQEPALHEIGEVQSIGILTQPVRPDLVGENGNIEEESHCAVPTILKRKQSRDQEKDLALGLGVTTCTPLPQQNTSSLAQKRDFCTFIREKKG